MVLEELTYYILCVDSDSTSRYSRVLLLWSQTNLLVSTPHSTNPPLGGSLAKAQMQVTRLSPFYSEYSMRVCDLCPHACPEYAVEIYKRLPGERRTIHGMIDLCDTCHRELKKWMDQQKEQKQSSGN